MKKHQKHKIKTEPIITDADAFGVVRNIKNSSDKNAVRNLLFWLEGRGVYVERGGGG